MSTLLRRLLPHIPLLIPLVFSVVMATVMRQPMFLLFGVLGPVMALSQRLITKQRDRDAQIERQKTSDARTSRATDESARAVESWRVALLASYPSVAQWLHNPLWRAESISATTRIRLGLGSADPPRDISSGGTVSDVPITVSLCERVAVVGSGPEGVARWRAIACQVLAVLATHPAQSGNAIDSMWSADSEPPVSLDIPGPRGESLGHWVFLSSIDELPRDTRWVITTGGAGSSLVHHRGVLVAKVQAPDRVSFAQSRWVRSRLTAGGSGGATYSLPSVDYTDRRHLVFSLDGESARVDMVDDGPHALLWGKTGSGKSVLLHRLIASLTASYSPELFGFVGIDFKGGATLGPLLTLPHCQGVLTDLADGSWARVATSLRAEVRAREEQCQAAGVSNWAELPPAGSRPRTLIVVDEAGTVATEAPELMGVLTDVAQRGRSLGLHLVFSTQRPQQLPRAVVVNCALRWCLGVTDADEASHFLPDTPRHLLAALTHAPPGTVLVRTGTSEQLIRPSVLEPGEIGAIARTGAQSQKPLWCELLPVEVSAPDPLPETPDGGYLLGLADIPQRQCHEWAVWEPRRDGPLIIVGEPRSGHTSCQTVLASQAESSGVRTVIAPPRPDALCDVLREVTNETDSPATMLIIDRLDVILQGLSVQAEAWFYDSLARAATTLIQRGAGSGLVLTVTPGSPCVSPLSRWSATWCLMRHRNFDQWVTAGGDRALYDRDIPPGRGYFRGHSVQWVTPRPKAQTAVPGFCPPAAPPGIPVVSGNHADDGGPTTMSVAEAEASHRGLTESLAGPGVIFAGVSAHHMRQLIGPGYDYPPVASAEPYGWWVTTGGFRLVDLSDHS